MKAVNYLIKEDALLLHYQPGKGAWTYHIIIPNSKDIKGKWGDIKVSGTIDGYPIERMNLAPMGDADKRLSINNTIRKAIQKSGGDKVLVTLYLDEGDPKLTEKEIRDTFKDSGDLKNFEKLPEKKQREVLDTVLNASSEEKQVELLVDYIELLNSTITFEQ